mmetsp:Transcript_26645/g.62585  ORF Transcript_26645/g.62585 Transcript_26645/m.62585 type:complete len:151 (-) Transcript_26645:199-651(-)
MRWKPASRPASIPMLPRPLLRTKRRRRLPRRPSPPCQRYDASIPTSRVAGSIRTSNSVRKGKTLQDSRKMPHRLVLVAFVRRFNLQLCTAEYPSLLEKSIIEASGRNKSMHQKTQKKDDCSYDDSIRNTLYDMLVFKIIRAIDHHLCSDR